MDLARSCKMWVHRPFCICISGESSQEELQSSNASIRYVEVILSTPNELHTPFPLDQATRQLLIRTRQAVCVDIHYPSMEKVVAVLDRFVTVSV